MNYFEHCAYNCATGEIICHSTSKQLRKSAKIASEWSKRFGYRNAWRFSHKGEQALFEKCGLTFSRRV